jgi:hypothetical protein
LTKAWTIVLVLDLAVFGDDPTTLLVDESEDDSPGADGFYGDNPNTPADESADDNPGALLAQFATIRPRLSMKASTTCQRICDSWP